MFEGVDERDLNSSCSDFFYSYPSIYPENSYIVRAGEACHWVIIIIDGVIELTDTTSNGAETTGSSSMIMTERLEKGQYYGQELLNWASLRSQLPLGEFLPRPIWPRGVKCRTKVEALRMGDCDLFDLIDKLFSEDYIWRRKKWVKRTLPHDNTDETLNKTNLQPATTELEEIEESTTELEETEESTTELEEIEELKKMKMKNMELDKGRGEPGEDIADTGASTSTTVEQRLDQIIQLQGDMQVLVRQIRDDMATQGRRLDDMAAFLATLGYPGISTPPAPSTLDEARI